MRGSEKFKGLKNAARFEFGYEKSKNKVYNLMLSWRSDYYPKNNIHSFIILEYQNEYQSNYDKKNVIVNKGFGHLRITKYLIPKLGFEFFSQLGFNDFLMINKRTLIGSGIRIKLFDTESIYIFSGSGFMHEDESYDFENQINKSTIRSTSYSTLDLKIINNVYLKSTIYFQPSFNDFKDFRMLIDNNLNVKLSKNFIMGLVIKFRFDNEPHGDLGKSYIQINNGFELNF